MQQQRSTAETRRRGEISRRNNPGWERLAISRCLNNRALLLKHIKFRLWLPLLQLVFAAFLLYQQGVFEFQHRRDDMPGISQAHAIRTAVNLPSTVYVMPTRYLQLYRYPVLRTGLHDVDLEDVCFFVGVFVLWYWVGTKIDQRPGAVRRLEIVPGTLLTIFHAIQAVAFTVPLVLIVSSLFSPRRYDPLWFMAVVVIWCFVLVSYSSFQLKRRLWDHTTS